MDELRLMNLKREEYIEYLMVDMGYTKEQAEHLADLLYQ